MDSDEEVDADNLDLKTKHGRNKLRNKQRKQSKLKKKIKQKEIQELDAMKLWELQFDQAEHGHAVVATKEETKPPEDNTMCSTTTEHLC